MAEGPEPETPLTVKVVVFEKLRCPYCGSSKVHWYGASRDKGVRYYQCKRCVYPDGKGEFTRFKALVK